MFAFCRSKPIRSIQYLVAQSSHARREDSTSPVRVRCGAEAGAALSWSLDDAPRPDYLASFKALKAAKGAGERKGAQIGIHVIAGVSPAWIKEAGDLHDPENPRNVALLEAARAWADSWSNGGCYAARIDLDETGGALVDLMIAPVEDQRHKSGKARPVVSVNKALEAVSLAATGKRGKHYSALNTSWAEFAQANLDPRLLRGKPKSQTGVEHVPPDDYRRMMSEAEAARKAAWDRGAEVARREAAVAERERAAAAAKAEAEAERDRLAATLDAFEALSEEIEAGTLREGKGGSMIAKNPARLLPGGRIVSRIARALLAVMSEVSALRTELRSALDEGRIRPEKRPAAEAAAARPARPSRLILAALERSREENAVPAVPPDPDPSPDPSPGP